MLAMLWQRSKDTETARVLKCIVVWIRGLFIIVHRAKVPDPGWERGSGLS